MQTEKIVGININPLTIKEAVTQIKTWIREGSAYFVSITSVNNVVSAVRDENLMKIQNSADMTTTDGMPLVWLLRLRGYGNIERVCGSDLMLAVLEMADKRVFQIIFMVAPMMSWKL